MLARFTAPRYWKRVELPEPVPQPDGSLKREIPPIYCPRGHKIHVNGRTLEGRGFVTCTHGALRRGAQACNLVIVSSTALRADDDKRYRIDIYATYDELRMIEEHSMSLAAMFAYLGVPWPSDIPYPHPGIAR